MAKTCVKDAAKLPQEQPRGRMVLVRAASGKVRLSDAQLRAQFERLLIFVLVSLWGLGLALWALLAIIGGAHAPASGGTTADLLSLSPYSVGVNVPIALARQLLP